MWPEEATLQEEAISPNVLFTHASLPPNASMPQGVNYRGQLGDGWYNRRRAKMVLIFSIKILGNICGSVS